MVENIRSADEFEIREVTAEDSDTMRRLAESNPDGGEIPFSPQYKADPYELHTKLIPADEITGFIAETPTGEAAGLGFIVFNDARLGGELRKRGYLAGLIVDHDHRNVGLGKRLAAKRIEYAETAYGEDVAITAGIQAGNDPSMAVAESWADSFPYQYVNQPIHPLDEPPESEYEIQRVEQADLPAFTDAINTFYDEAELYSPYGHGRLADLYTTTVNGEQPHRCKAVVDDGDLVAGAHIIDQYKLMTMVVEELPEGFEDTDDLPPSIPDDLEIRPSSVVPWFEPGYEDAAEALIQHERATVKGPNRFTIGYDPDGPLSRLDPLTPDEGALELNWAIRGFDEPASDMFVAPGLG